MFSKVKFFSRNTSYFPLVLKCFRNSIIIFINISFYSMNLRLNFFSFLLFSILFSASAEETIQFNRDVRPILSGKCFHCHGPSEKFREADLRLDLPEEAYFEKDGFAAVVPGSTEDSEVWHRIVSDDVDEIMPPPESKKELTEREKEILTKWIEQGAKWEGHWSYLPVQKPELPSNSNTKWAKNPIDHFIHAKLDEFGLTPSPEADRRTLIRRLYLDLAGLPPSPAQVNEFLADQSSEAYEKLVDRLLASDEYAERMTLVWMDAARYGDTSVFHDDGPRNMWPWRDWVLNAYRDNMPFDQFTVEQIAGDLLPEASLQQKIASGFNRNHATTDEGGAIAEEFRVEYVVDRVKTTSNVWLGMTFECAQCHDHMYDPFSQKEYYQMFAFFNNNADPGMQTRRGNTAPVVELMTPEREKQIDNTEKALQQARGKLSNRRKESLSPFKQWFSNCAKNINSNPGILDPEGLVGFFPFDRLDFENNQSDRGVPEATPAHLHDSPLQVANAKFKGGIRIEKNAFIEVPKLGDFEHNQAFSLSAWIKPSNTQLSGAVIGKMDEGNKFRGYDLWLEGGRPGMHIIHAWPDNAMKVVAKNQLKQDKWQHVCVTYDGKTSANSVEIYVNGKKQDKGNPHAKLKKNSIKTDKPLRIGRRYRSAQLNDTEIDDIRVYNRALSQNEVPTVMELSYRFIPLPKGQVAGINFNQFEGNQTKDEVNPKESYVLHGEAEKTELAKLASGFKIEKSGFLESKTVGVLEYNQSFSWSMWVKPTKKLSGAILSKMDENEKHRGYDVWMENGRPGMHIVNEWPENAIKVVAKSELPLNEWNHLCVTYDGSGKANGVKVFINGTSQQKDIARDELNATIKTDKTFRVGRRYYGASVNGLEIDEIALYHRALNHQQIEKLSKLNTLTPLFKQPLDSLANAQRTFLHDEYLNRFDSEYKILFADRNGKQTQLNKLRNDKITSMVMGDNPSNKMRETYLLVRGQYSSPDKSKVIQANTPNFLPSMNKEQGNNRLGLAKWLTDKQNPLTPRVTVNRYWQTIFGRGLSDTPSDFGSQGKWPTHPGLLNWLAADFLESDWDVKKMIRQLVTSATYRQSSVTKPEHMEKDPENLYFARSPRFRMMGEFVRDQALQISGLLKKKFGGPGVKPYQPAGLWNEVSLNAGLRFVQDKGDKVYRRSMYTYWKRSSPQPAMVAFDTPSREICTVQRQRTNTPMQSLVTLNDIQFVEASRFFAQRVLLTGPKDLPGRVNRAFELATGRPADNFRQKIISEAYHKQKASFQKEPAKAEQLLAMGDTPRDKSLNSQEHATWTVLASMILNLDETLNRE
jgi:hypothetical protein